jgi:hypothetical protein
MVGDERADGTIVMRDSIRRVMKRESQNGERKANEQKMDKFPVH